MKLKKILNLFAALIIAISFTGCAKNIFVSPQLDRSGYSLLNRPDDLMPLTSNVLSNFSLYRKFHREPDTLLATLEKIFFTESDTGHIGVPKGTAGGTCEIRTDTGDITFTIVP